MAGINNIRTEFDKFWCEERENAMHARNKILGNICPQLCGMYIVKLAVALTIMGGVAKQEINTRIRGQSHLLMVGDPGTGMYCMYTYNLYLFL